eukprot:1156890-Pelagomonas_calceolata.AAC.4
MGLGDRSGSHDDHEPGVDGREGEEGLLVPEATHGTHGHLHVAYDDEELKEEHPPAHGGSASTQAGWQSSVCRA